MFFFMQSLGELNALVVTHARSADPPNVLDFVGLLLLLGVQGFKEVKIELKFELVDEKHVEGVADNTNATTPDDVCEWAFNVEARRRSERNRWQSNKDRGNGKCELVMRCTNDQKAYENTSNRKSKC
jgi:hypothetical protein